MKDEIHKLLDQKVKQYNHIDFIGKDPICIPHLFTKQQDIEIAAFFAAIFTITHFFILCYDSLILFLN